MGDRVIKLLPYKFIHVLDLNENVTFLEVGPKTYTCLSDKKVVFGPESMIIIPPNAYCIIKNPVQRNDDGSIIYDERGQPLLRHTELEVRLPGQPFPLYPGELIQQGITQMELIPFDCALHLTAIRDVEITDPQQLCSILPNYPHPYNNLHLSSDDDHELNEPYFETTNDAHVTNNINQMSTKKKEKEENVSIIEKSKSILKKAGEEWYFVGPGHYIPNVAVNVIGRVNQVIIAPGNALKLRAKRDLYDNYYNKFRKNGEVWLLKEACSYLPNVYEEVLQTVKPIVITEKKGIRVRAIRDFIDDYNIQRKFGEVYLITYDLTNAHLLHVNEEFIQDEDAIVLSSRECAIISNPFNSKSKKFLLGKEKVVRGPKTFFLHPPYETLISIQNVTLLSSNQMLTITAKETIYDLSDATFDRKFIDDDNFIAVDLLEDEGDRDVQEIKRIGKLRKAASIWYVYGPGEFWRSPKISVTSSNAIIEIQALNLRIFSILPFVVCFLSLLIYVCFRSFSA